MIRPSCHWTSVLVALCFVAAFQTQAKAQSQQIESSKGQTLEDQLLAETAESLANDASTTGDAKRGAIVFHQPYMSCRQCHDADDATLQLGPDLSRWDHTKPTDAQLVDAILRPSKEIRKGFDSLSVLTEDGDTFVGLIVKRTDDEIVLRDPSRPGRTETFDVEALDAVRQNKNSLMPVALVNQLSSRQQFLDLVRYLIEIRDGGPITARNLKPPAHLYAARPIPEYEKTIDHAGMISDLGRDNFKRGEAIYTRMCVNCHGTHDKPGSLPTSLKFASGKFKNGSDPFTMYQTLTRGFGMMQPQSWMVPQQKYDVIHYIREAYLKKNNPSQYHAVSSDWLAGLPKGTSRGPSPQNLEKWVTMDYGRSLINTYEIGNDGSNFAYKGIAVRLDAGPGGVSRGRHWMIFDHDTLRMAAAWSGDRFIDWKGIHFNGQHNIHPRVAGQVHAENKTGPGWADPDGGGFEDVRLVGRDDRRYGPLPRSWGQYQGVWQHNDQTVIDYRVGETSVSEIPLLLAESPTPVFARQIHVGPRRQAMTVQVATLAEGSRHLRRFDSGSHLLGPDTIEEPKDAKLVFDGGTHAQIDDGDSFDMTGKDFTITARIKTKKGGSIFAKAVESDRWQPDGKVFFVRGGRLVYDIGWVGAVQSSVRVNDGKWHDVAMSWSHESSEVRLFVDGKPAGRGRLRPKSKQTSQVVRLGFGAPDFPGPQSHFQGDMEYVRFYSKKLGAADLGGDLRPVAHYDLRGATGTVLNQAADRDHAQVRRDAGAVKHSANYFVAGLRKPIEGVTFEVVDDTLRATLPAGDQPLAMTLWFASADSPEQASETDQLVSHLARPAITSDWQAGSPARTNQLVLTEPIVGEGDGPFAVDVLTRPETNPWLAQVRLTGFDFFADGDSAAVCAWDGDVWKVTGINNLDGSLSWQRIATGLFQPLGVRIVDGQIYVTCRDQIVILHDVNGDGETDHYEAFNSDHQVTDHFHEFAMGLQTDDDGNFYYAKSARHALTAVVPHHGTLLRVSKDGSRTDIVANGFRAANGVCLNPDGTFIVTDQEGHWNPKNRINWVREGGFYGNMYGYHDVTDSSDEAMDPPLCWITNQFDRSPAELLWVPKGCWGPLGETLLNLSYGYGKVFVVPHEHVGDRVQGGMCELPLPQFPTGLVRGRFHPTNGHLYTCGMFAWAGNQQQPGGFYRIRATGKPMHLPVGLEASTGNVKITFTDALADSATKPENYHITAWDLKRTKSYGSKHYNERNWNVTEAKLSRDGKVVSLSIPELEPTWGMEIRCFVESPDGRTIERRIHNTIHELK